MIQLERLAGITPSVFFYCSGNGCRFALFPAVSSDYSVSLLLTILFLVWYRIGKWGGLFWFSAGSDQRKGDFLIYLGLMGAGNRLEDLLCSMGMKGIRGQLKPQSRVLFSGK
ncbi:hypothetical protein DXB71_17710 [Blautia sp. OM05-6]|jgi:hypothetical protein|uniref:hypothetical protein n=1 Tax=Blautia sp. OM05-6 TaxID=2292983 RepID=UPI000E53F2D5|nr:hypothetical protein [Blautia sp. OM05-6]RHV20495.1 hypothetical protein DXB71_17710 [Blautia sp. OM05-6]